MALNILDARKELTEMDQTLLLADSCEQVRRLCQRVLEMHGFHVLTAESASDALQLWQVNRDRLGIFLIDTCLRGRGDYRLNDLLEGIDGGCKILFLFGSANEDLPLRWLQTNPVLSKPFRAVELVQAVHEALQAPLFTVIS